MYFISLSILLAKQEIEINDSSNWLLYQKEEQVRLDLHWYISKPFIYPNEKGELIGLEYDILLKFQTYAQEKYGINLQYNWKEMESFSDIIQHINANKGTKNNIGVSAFSITSEREDLIDFSNAYLADFTVLVSSSGTPIYKTFEDARLGFKNMEAITIEGTTYESFLLEMKEQLGADYEILYINSDKNILEAILNKSNRFGFIDLPIYLMLLKNGGGLTRQNFFTKKGNGYAFVFSENSVWQDLMNDFLADSSMQIAISEIVAHYMGEELYQFINTIYGDQNIGTSLLTKEKELQLEQLKANKVLLENERHFKYALIIGISFLILLVLIIFRLFLRKQKVSKAIKKQKDKIEEQQLSIKQKNDMLFNRNIQLTSLNEEKNNLVKILAHDLRTPINHIKGLLDVLSLSAQNLSEEHIGLIKQVKDASERVNLMIMKILDFDALEGNRMKVMVERINISELLMNLKDEFASQTELKNIQLQIKCPKRIVLSTDYLFLTQIIENLLSNAIKFSDRNTTVKIDAYSSNGHVFIEVTDEGPGLTDEDKMLIFNKYQKLSAKPTNGEDSTGLGLSIVKKYITLLGGEIQFDSIVGVGTKFTLNLPIKKED